MDEDIKEKKGTTVVLDNDSYKLVKNKQFEIFNETDKSVSIQSISSEAVKKGIDLINKDNIK